MGRCDPYTGGGGLGVWRHCPCGPPTADDATPWLYLFHDGGDVRVVYVPDLDTPSCPFDSAPRCTRRFHIVDGIDDFVFAAIADRRGRPAATDD